MDLREVTEFFKDSFKYIISIAIVLFIVIFIVSFQPVAGNSMFPTLNEGDVVVVQKLFSKSTKYQRNEIVVLKNHKKSYIKRIIGLPGEEVHYLDDTLYINDEPFKETFLGEGIKTSNFLFVDICSLEDCPDSKIPEDYYLVMGDNRPQSEDSRTPTFGLVHKKDIEGRVLFRIWPLSSMGSVN